MATPHFKPYSHVLCISAILLVAFGCSESDAPGGPSNQAGHAGEASESGGASIGGEAGAGHGGARTGTGGQAGSGAAGAPEAEGGAAGNVDAPCVAPDGTTCPEGYEPLEGYVLDEQNECLTNPTVLTCRIGGTGLWWCVVDTEDGTVYYVPEMTCSHTTRFRLGTDDECAEIQDVCG